ncbi:MAG: type II restriction endonuclease [Mycoplasmataceae bacterium]|nr:type II restriction endonuclease [Mycoplasmataceae bacterium]
MAQESKKIKGFKFMWVTDGAGWKSAKNNLKETFEQLENLYNINNLRNGVLNNLIAWKSDLYIEIDALADKNYNL